MTRLDWFLGGNTAEMLNWLADRRLISSRQARLFGWNLWVEYAMGVEWSGCNWRRDLDWIDDPDSRRPPYWNLGEMEPGEFAATAIDNYTTAGIRPVHYQTVAGQDNNRRRVLSQNAANILRAIKGDPFTPTALCGRARKPFHNQHAHVDENGGFWLEAECRDCQRLLSPNVLAIAQKIYDRLDWDSLPLLADALEEVGCENATILQWLREKQLCANYGREPPIDGHLCSIRLLRHGGLEMCPWCGGYGYTKPHYCRGDWTLDLILGKEP